MYATPTKYPKFCEDCGTKLVWSKPEFGTYREDTGKRRVYRQLICPSKRWYQILHSHPYRRTFDGMGAHKIYYWRETAS